MGEGAVGKGGSEEGGNVREGAVGKGGSEEGGNVGE